MTETMVAPAGATGGGEREREGTASEKRLSALARELQGSEILRIATEVRRLIAAGAEVCNLTVGDFSPSEFRIPPRLEEGIVDALRRGESNYPPSYGIDPLRKSIRDFIARRLGLEYRVPEVLVTSGARPAIYTVYRAIVDRGDRVVYAVPSWNNNYYTEMVGGVSVPVVCGPDTNFQPTADTLRDAVRGARLLALCSPQNPTGTIFDADTLVDICDLVLEENARRGASERPLYLMYDQVYWMLTFGGAEHVNPVALRPAMAPYTIQVDAISKAFAATGLRVGWAFGPEDVITKMGDIITHVGAWAPKPEQVATAALLADDASVDEFIARMRREVRSRLDLLARGLRELASEGFPVESTEPQGAIYLSARLALHGWRTPEGTRLTTNAAIASYLLNTAGFAMVPFQAFAAREETGWFRLSAGAISEATVSKALPRLRSALAELRSDGARA